MTEDDLIDLLGLFFPESLEGWLALAVIICAILAFALPAPSENAHPAVKTCHRIICILGMGAGKMRAAGKLGKIGKLTGIFRRKND